MKQAYSPRSRARGLVGNQMAALTLRDDQPGQCYFIAHVAATVFTGWLLWLSFDTVFVAFAILVHGVVLVHWFAPFHEAAHFTVFKSRKLNRWLGVFSGYIVWLPFDYFVLEHRQHHLFTNLPEQDSEYIPHAKTRRGWWLYVTALPYFYNIFSAFIRYPLGQFSESEKSFLGVKGMAAARKEMAIMVSVYSAIIIAASGLGWIHAVFWYWVLPRMLAEPIMRVIRLSEHGGCAEVPDMLRNTRTVMAAAPLRQLNWNMCFHAEHHALASVPFHRLPQAHELLKVHIEELSASYFEASKDTLTRAEH